MHKLKKLSLFIIAFFLLQAAACRKDKKITPASPKTVEDYISQMVGTYNMVGEVVLTNPDTAYRVSKTKKWIVNLVSSQSISVEGESGKFVYSYHDTLAHTLKLVRQPEIYTRDHIKYYYLSDSIIYFGYVNTSMSYYEENLHSVK